jgi:hypothetical protein
VDRIKASENVPREELYPEHAILLSEFLKDEEPSAKDGKPKPKEKEVDKISAWHLCSLSTL